MENLLFPELPLQGEQAIMELLEAACLVRHNAQLSGEQANFVGGVQEMTVHPTSVVRGMKKMTRSAPA
jgi:hypothetical protein